MLSLVLALVAAQTAVPQEAAPARGVVVMSSRSEGLTPIEVVTLTERLSKALQDARVEVAMSPDEATSRLGPDRRPELCQVKPECIAERGRALGVGAVVALDSSKVFGDLPMRVILVETGRGQVLLRRSYTVSPARLADLDTAFRDASQEIKKTLSGRPGFEEPLPADAPKEPPPVALTPKPAQEQPPALVVSSQPSRVPVYLTRGGAAVAGGAAVYFLVRGLMLSSELQQEGATSGVSRWTYPHALELKDDANRNLLISGVLAGAAGVLLGTSFLLPSPEPAPAQ
ncbi:hypothetical protein [Archangium lansingense]|uniref:Uncharacterized protein n=1 Tax=Archangium lansingense TaxID=2995310 RepID=A0ABT4AHP5_9BACT|nr:hypothetical protein [Archangium lansinium]MCY1081195.1 hypothetical protein [Archangium lansinium]